MDFMIKTRTGQTYRVPEDMIPRVAQAMLDGGTAEKVEPVKNTGVLTAAMNRAAGAVQTAAHRFFGARVPQISPVKR